MACGPKEYRAHAETCLRRARTVRNPILAEEFEKLAQSWLRLAEAAKQGEVRFVLPPTQKHCIIGHGRTSSVPRPCR
jgi:hypothetical protein